MILQKQFAKPVNNTESYVKVTDPSLFWRVNSEQLTRNEEQKAQISLQFTIEIWAVVIPSNYTHSECHQPTIHHYPPMARIDTKIQRHVSIYIEKTIPTELLSFKEKGTRKRPKSETCITRHVFLTADYPHPDCPIWNDSHPIVLYLFCLPACFVAPKHSSQP